MTLEGHTRRQFIHAAAATAMAAGAPRLMAAKFDLLITGGRVVDPSQRIDGPMDVAVAAGRIAAVRSQISTADATDVIDGRGKIVTPGLVDIHAHLDSPDMPPAHCLSTGVTSIVDGGSRGADNVAELVSVARSAPNRVRLLLNLSRMGLVGGGGELLDLAKADADAARRAIASHADVIIGMKARLSANVAGDHDLAAIRRAHEVIGPLGLPLMVHIGQTRSPLPAILDLLRPGDIVTHVYAPPPNSIFDENGRVLPQVRAARERGVLFDVGNGRTAHITWEMAERALEQGFLPDTISSDLTAPGRTDRVFDFPTVLSKFLMLGLSLEQVIARATVNAAKAVAPFKELGTLRVGAPADVAVFTLERGSFEFVDNERARRTGLEKLVPFAVVAAGKRVGIQTARVKVSPESGRTFGDQRGSMR